MTSQLTRFDDWLNRLLERCAREAGEDVGTYVARAVASQMVADQRIANSASVEKLMTHLSNTGVFDSVDMPSAVAALADPDRLAALYATGLLDSPVEEVYDRITRAAAAALDAPFAAICLVDIDRLFLKSTFGMGIESDEERHGLIKRSVCQYAVANGASLILEDARIDPVFKNHPAVRDGSVVAYLGIPLVDCRRNAIGTLCVYDLRPRLWSSGHVRVLSDLAGLVAERVFGAGSALSA